jgi:hypothetical protein
LHAITAKLGDPALAGPILSVIAIVSLWSCARKIWPEDHETQATTILLIVVAGQFFFSGMSPFAMQAHLAFNLVWLRLFLADRRRADFAAIAVGWFATGLHQPLFHPLFAGPFLLVALRKKQFGRIALYGLGYSAIALFWLAWPKLTLALVSGPASITPDVGIDYFSRLTLALSLDHTNFSVMAANLLRFVAWQHLLLIPLVAFSVHCLRGNPLAQAMFIGPVATVIIMAVILPWQGYGFGYRYLHGQMASLVLLAGFGWSWLRVRMPQAQGLMCKATLGGALLLVPLQGAMAHRFYAAYAETSDKIDSTGADFVLIDDEAGYQAETLVLNNPDLSNRPLRLTVLKVRDPDRLANRICKPGIAVAVGNNAFYNRLGRAYFLPPVAVAETALTRLIRPFRRAGCRVIIMN